MNPAAWMLFVDGENFTIRAQELAKQSPPPGVPLSVDPKYYLRDAELAGMIGVHPVTIARWETEMRRISQEMAARLLTLIAKQKRTERQRRRAKSSKSKRKG